MTLAWIYLFIAGIFEIGWPLGLKLAQKTNFALGGFAMAGFAMTCSGFFLYLAQKQIPIGTAYGIWTGIGAVGTFLVGVIFFGDSSSMIKFLGIGLIVLGIISLKVG